MHYFLTSFSLPLSPSLSKGCSLCFRLSRRHCGPPLDRMGTRPYKNIIFNFIFFIIFIYFLYFVVLFCVWDVQGGRGGGGGGCGVEEGEGEGEGIDCFFFFFF